MRLDEIKREIIAYLYRHPDEKIVIIGWGVMSYREVADRAVRDKKLMNFLLDIFVEMVKQELIRMGLETRDETIYSKLIEMLRGA